MIPLVIIGAGGFGREVVDVVRAINAVQPKYDLLGVVDDAPSQENLGRIDALGVPYLGQSVEVGRLECQVTIGVGSPSSRQRLWGVLDQLGIESPKLIHPSAWIGSQFRASPGLVVCDGVSIGTNVGLGHHVHLNPRSIVGHDTTLGNCVSLNPNATVSGDCSVESCVLVGSGAVVIEGMTVGEGTTVGACACVVRDVPPSSVMVGVPAKPIRKSP